MTDNPALYEAIRDVNRPIHDRNVFVPACRLEDLGDASFRADHRLRFAYVAGAMANGIGSVEVVEAMSRAGMLGFFGAAGLPPARVEAAIDRLSHSLGDAPHGFNLIHSPNEPDLENAVVDLYLSRGVRLVEASAYLDLTPALVRYRIHGIHADAAGRVVTPNRVIAKVSRVEVASKFFAPPPDRILQELLRTGTLTPEQARLAARIPVAQDLTAEADSGGHTDNRPLVTLLPTMLALRDRLQAEHRYDAPLRVGAAGGIATPAAAAAAFVMGASYVLTGSINQACVESGSSDAVREMLAQAEQADVIMAPAADMFEMGVKVQVLKRGTMFAMRAAKLYELYRTCARLEDLPAAERAALEKNLFRAPLEEIWTQTRVYFQERDRVNWNVPRASRNIDAPVFRWYLGQSSRWATPANRRASWIIRYGAVRRWARSMSGPKGRFWNSSQPPRCDCGSQPALWGGGADATEYAACQGVPFDPEWSRLTPTEPERLELSTQ